MTRTPINEGKISVDRTKFEPFLFPIEGEGDFLVREGEIGRLVMVSVGGYPEPALIFVERDAKPDGVAGAGIVYTLTSASARGLAAGLLQIANDFDEGAGVQ